MAEFLLEVFSEEIPARMQAKAATDLHDMLTKGLKDKGLTFTSAQAHSTPRRITLVVDGLPAQQPDIAVEKRGPRTDAPQQAIDGFLKVNNLANLDRCTKEETPKGAFWFYRENVKGAPTQDILVQLVDDVLKAFPWPKSMRWTQAPFTWVRPMRSIIALFDGKALNGKFNIDANNAVAFANKTEGHRFLSPGEISVTNFADYKKKLETAHVLLERTRRKEIITGQAQALATKEGLKVREDDGLMEEIVGLVEWPVSLLGAFEKEYLEVPEEVLVSTMRSNQKYIALLDKDGKLSNKFVVVANTETVDGGKQVIAGNERVLRARLSDAKFFWDQDRKQKLESRNAALEQITFHKKLGTVKERVERLQALSKECAALLYASDANVAKSAVRAAQLSKADLVSGVVFQFPEVQGIMGCYYAKHDGETDDVAKAISDHYKPVGANDICPTKPVSICVSLADKIDALVGFFAIDEKPTGSKDPFALRRAALGVIRIVVENNLRLPLKTLFEKSYQLYKVKVSCLQPVEGVTDSLMQFFIDRLKVVLKDEGLRHDYIDAVLAAKADDDLTRVVKRARALKDFLSTPDGTNLLAAYKRATNIVRAEEKKDSKMYNQAVNAALFKEEQEKSFAKGLADTVPMIKAALDQEDFQKGMNAMSTLRKPLDDFFEKIMVNAPEPDVRVNRLCLLSQLREAMNVMADFSKIEG